MILQLCLVSNPPPTLARWHGAFPFTEIKVPVLLHVPAAIKETALSPVDLGESFLHTFIV